MLATTYLFLLDRSGNTLLVLFFATERNPVEKRKKKEYMS